MVSPSSGSRKRSPSPRRRPPGAKTAAASGVLTRIGSRMSKMCACSAFSGTPPRASAAAGAARSAAGSEPQRSIAAARPAGEPYAPTDAGPMLKTCAASPKDTSTGRRSARCARSAPRPGASTKKSSRVGSSPAPATRRYPPAPGPVSSGSATRDASTAATAASTAFPPSRSTRAPASAVIGWPAATMPVGSALTARMMARTRCAVDWRAAVSGADDSQAFKDFETAGWSANAARYGDLTGRITAHVADALLDAAGVKAGTRVLDVGCGRGDLCAAAAARGARPLGVDLAEGMIDAAREAHPALEFRRGDAEHLPLERATFDAALAACVVNHLPHAERGAAELRRVLVPGGRVAVAMWGPPERVEFLGLFDEAMRAAHINRELAFPPGPSAFRFSDAAELRGLLEGAGFGDVAIEEVAFRFAIADLDELWQGVQTGSVRTAAQLRALDDDELARVRGALDDLLEERRSTGGLELETAVNIASGVSPAA